MDGHVSARWIRKFLIGVVLAAGLTGPAAASDNPTLDWLMNEPVTLFDLGMIRLTRDLDEFADRIHERGLTARRPSVGTYYEWKEKRIVAYILVRGQFTAPSRQACADVFGRMVDHLVSKAPAETRQPAWYLERIFTHDGPGNFLRPKTMARDLLESVHMEVSLISGRSAWNAEKTQCAGRLDSELSELRYKGS